MTARDHGHDEGPDIGMDAVPAAFRSAPPYDPDVDDTPTRRDEGQEAAGTGPRPDRASRPGHRRRWVVLAVGLVVIGIAAGVIAITRHGPSDTTAVDPNLYDYGPPDTTVVDPNLYDVTFYVTGSSQSANLRYTLLGTMTLEDDNLDLAELARDNPTPDVWPLGHAARFPRGSHIFIEVRNNLPSGDVACMIDYSLSGDSKIEKRGASVAVCEVYLQ